MARSSSGTGRRRVRSVIAAAPASATTIDTTTAGPKPSSSASGLPAPLVRLGILRSSSLVRANLGAMALIGGWFGFQFIATLYMQQARGWSPLETGLAIFPGGILVAVLAPRIGPLVARFGTSRLIAVGLLSAAVGYALFLPIGVDSPYLTAMLPTMILAGLGFALAYGPVNIAATSGIAPEEQGLASGLVNTSFQFGGALTLAVATAVNDAYTGGSGSAEALIDGFVPAVVVSMVVALAGVAAMTLRTRLRTVPELERAM